MNKVIIRQTYLSSKLEILINNDPISSYSDLASLVNRPFSEWGPRILQELDEEVYDPYSLDFYAFPFQYEILKYYQKDSKFCEKIILHDIISIYSQDFIKKMFQDICSRYHLCVIEDTGISLYSEVPVIRRNGFIVTDNPIADLCIVTDRQRAVGTTNIILSEDNSGISTDGNIIFYSIRQELTEKFLDYYKTGIVDTVYIEKCLNAFQYADLNQKDKTFIQSVITNQPGYYVGEIPETIDSGEKIPFSFESFPEDFFKPVSDDPSVMRIEQNHLYGCNGGTASICIKNKQGNIVWTRQVKIIHHNYAREIQFIPKFSFLKIHEKNQFEIVVLPSDAEDVNCLEWSVEPYSMAQITNEGEITALQTGTAIVKVKGKRTEAVCKIEIKSGVDRLSFDTQKIRIFNGEERIIECRTFPNNAAIENLEWSFDNKNIAFCNPSKDGMRCLLTASENYTGTGNLVCYDPASGLRAICNIEVAKNKIKDFLAAFVIVMMLFGFASPLFSFLSIAVSGFSLWKYWGQKKLIPFWVGGILSVLILLMNLS